MLEKQLPLQMVLALAIMDHVELGLGYHDVEAVCCM